MKFILKNGQDTVASWDTDFLISDDPIVIHEELAYNFFIEDIVLDCDYYLSVGDEKLADIGYEVYGEKIYFKQSNYFESAAGETEFFVYKHTQSLGDSLILRKKFYVLPSKIGEENYQKMVRDLQIICNSLIKDLMGKSRHNQTFENIKTKIFRSHEEELKAIRKTWKEFYPIIKDIINSPNSFIKTSLIIGRCSQQISHTNQIRIMKKGINPLQESNRKCLVSKRTKSYDQIEHRLLKMFILLLQGKLTECLKGIKNDIAVLEKDKNYRSHTTSDDEVSLYISEDLPRINILHKNKDIALQLYGEMATELEDDFWKSISTAIYLPENNQFSENSSYRRAANIILQYLRSGFLWSTVSGMNFMTKKSSRMYEQWILIQLVTAFEKAGLPFQTWDDVINESLSTQFGLDFKRNTTFFARLNTDYFIRLRYEPWILPRKTAEIQPNETLYHGGSDNGFWSPDIVIELQKKSPELHTVYAIAIDCKYSRNPHEKMRDNVRKYDKIHAVPRGGKRGKQVAKQVWIVYPGQTVDTNHLKIEDESFSFSDELGPFETGTDIPCYDDDLIFGDIIARPVHNLDEKHATSTSLQTKLEPETIFTFFAKGTLNFLNHLCDSDEDLCD